MVIEDESGGGGEGSWDINGGFEMLTAWGMGLGRTVIGVSVKGMG